MYMICVCMYVYITLQTNNVICKGCVPKNCIHAIFLGESQDQPLGARDPLLPRVCPEPWMTRS